MMSPGEQAQIRTDAAYATLDLTCTISRATLSADDGQGGESKTWGTVATVLAGMAQPTSGQMQNYEYVIGSLSAWQIKMPYGTDVRVNDQLTIGSSTLMVYVVLAPRSYAALTTVLAAQVEAN